MFNITVYSKEILEYHISKTAYVVVREGGGGTWGGIGEEEENELKLLGIGFT